MDECKPMLASAVAFTLAAPAVTIFREAITTVCATSTVAVNRCLVAQVETETKV